MEFLGAQITNMCEEKRWDKMQASRHGLSFSHVFFADDLMLFAKANHKNCDVVIEVLDNFCILAGEKVNLKKSKILFSPNVPRRRKRFICRKMGMNATNNLGRYLGFPILTQGRPGNAYNFIVDRVQNKLAGWRTKLLSRAGKLVLVKFVVALIADYFMQCQALPNKVCDAVDKTIRDFLWGSTDEKRNMHMVKWSMVTLPKVLRGLGLHSIRDKNLALLAKLCWRLASSQDSPWAAMLAAKYLTSKRMTEDGRKLPCSSMWSACKKGGPIYVKGLKWSVRSGESIKFWMDYWLSEGSLRSLIQGPLNRDEKKLTVRQYLVHEGDRRNYIISFKLPDRLFKAIQATPLSIDQNAEDLLHWAHSKNGFFSLKSAYLLARV